MASPGKIAVIGGGIGGLTAALALLKRGLDVDIYEQAPELKEVGAGIQISSNGTRVLFALGLEDALKQVQVQPSKRQIRHWRTGETWNWFDLGQVTQQRYGTPHVMLHRGDLHGLLADAVRNLKPDAVHLKKRCAALAQSADHAEVTFTDGETVTADYVMAPTASIPRSGNSCSVRTSRSSPAAWRGAVWCRCSNCRRTSLRCSAPTGSVRTATCCTTRCGVARS